MEQKIVHHEQIIWIMEQKSIQLEQVIRIYGTKQMYILNKQYILTEQMRQRYIHLKQIM